MTESIREQLCVLCKGHDKALQLVDKGSEPGTYHVEVVAEGLGPPPLILLRALLAVVAGCSHVQDRLCGCFAALCGRGNLL